MSSQDLPGRRVVQTAYGHTIFVRPPATRHDYWGDGFERRALLNGYLAVIDGEVIYPGTDAARTAIAKISGSVS